MTPVLASLFREGEMRKPAKNVLRNHLLQSGGKRECQSTEVLVIDAGELLLHTSWHSKNRHDEVVQKYSKYTKDNFNQQNVIVIFDGNYNINSTKGEEHCRSRKGGSSALVNIKNQEQKQHAKNSHSQRIGTKKATGEFTKTYFS